MLPEIIQSMRNASCISISLAWGQSFLDLLKAHFCVSAHDKIISSLTLQGMPYLGQDVRDDV